MMRLWCWLFAACVAAPPPPPAPPARNAPVAAEAPRPAPLPVAAGKPDEPAAPLAPPAVRLSLAAPPPAAPAEPPPAWRRFEVPAPPALDRPTIAVVIDDMGANSIQSARAAALPGAVTLAWLPYAPHLAEQVAAAAARGHEAMLEMPMEPLGRPDAGPDALRTWRPPAANLAHLRAALDLLPGAVALTPHEGGVATLSVPLMDLLMGELRTRGVAFLDGESLPHGVALARAEAAGVPALARDMPIDGDPSPAAIRARLAEMEKNARRNRHAILIGRARASTMDVLEPYLPSLAARGFVLWPISADIAAETRIALGATQEGVTQAAVAPPAGSGAE